MVIWGNEIKYTLSHYQNLEEVVKFYASLKFKTHNSAIFAFIDDWYPVESFEIIVRVCKKRNL